MAFTYVGTLASDRDLVRFNLRDTVSASGPLPGDNNFTDAEIDGLLTAEGSVGRATAAGFEALAAAWARYVTFDADGASVNRSDIAKMYKDMAASWRTTHGNATAVASRAGSVSVIRRDGFSDDLDNVTATDST